MAKPVSSAGAIVRQDHLGEGLQPRGAQRGGGFLELFLGVFEHRLHRAHHERQPDEDQRDHDARRREGQLDAVRLQQLPDPAVAREQRRQRDAGHGRGQRERQVDQRIDDALARKLVAHQHPGHQQAEHRFTSAAISEAPKVRRYEAITRGAVTATQNWSQVSVKVLKTSADSGISTIRLR
jgi:hypothetical protein